MPIYEYECQSCGRPHEALQKVNDAPLIDCPSCGQPKLGRILSAAGFRLKGAGWYETDFKKDNRRNLAGEEGASTSASGGESSPPAVAESASSTEAKPAVAAAPAAPSPVAPSAPSAPSPTPSST